MKSLILSLLFVSSLACGQGVTTSTPQGSTAVAYWGAHCHDTLAVWVLLDDGHLIQYDKGTVPPDFDWGDLLGKLKGLKGSVVDLCPAASKP